VTVPDKHRSRGGAGFDARLDALAKLVRNITLEREACRGKPPGLMKSASSQFMIGIPRDNEPLGGCYAVMRHRRLTMRCGPVADTGVRFADSARLIMRRHRPLWPER